MSQFDIQRLAHGLVALHFRSVALAIALVTVVQVDNPFHALVSGGLLNLVLAASLAMLAINVSRRDCRRMRIWRAVGRRLALPLPAAQRLVAEAMAWAYWRFARLAGMSGAMFVGAGAVWRLGRAAF
jgi:hypothetical protein